MERLKEFIVENRLVFIIGIMLLLLIAWLHHDANRNAKDYNNTDRTMERIEERISSIESRLTTMSSRLDQAQKTVNGISERVEETAVAHDEVNVKCYVDITLDGILCARCKHSHNVVYKSIGSTVKSESQLFILDSLCKTSHKIRSERCDEFILAYVHLYILKRLSLFFCRILPIES